MIKTIILDRDGVINHDSDDYIKSADEWVPIPGSLEAIAKLSDSGYRVFVVTNQSGLARGYFDLQTLEAMHTKFRALLKEQGGQIEDIYYCPHMPEDACDCRKPLPGMFHQIAARLGGSLDGVVAVGDSLRDLLAAQAAGATPVLVRTGKGERTIAKGVGLSKIPIFDDLASVVDNLLSVTE